MLKVLVLGSNSFAGAVFVNEALNRNFKVLGVSRSDEKLNIFLPYKFNKNYENFRFEKIHIVEQFETLIRLIANFKPEYIVDFAGQGMVAESWNEPELWFMTNFVSKARLHDFLRQQSYIKKYIRVSTPEVYGSTEKKIKESFLYNPSTPYAVSHAAIDLSLMSFFKNYSFPVVLTRFSNFYGPGQQLYRIIPKTILAALTKTRLQLHGGGTSIRSFIYGVDVAKGLLLAIDKAKPGEIYHFSDTQFITIYDLIVKIAKKLNVDANSIIEVKSDRPGKDKAYLMDATKASSHLGWKPQFNLDTGLDQTIDWIKTNLNEMKDLTWNYEHKK